MRLLLVGAFVYPHHQGTQVYFQEQAIALRAAGAEVDLLTYGAAARSTAGDPERWRALDGFAHRAIPRGRRPGSGASGFQPGKPIADVALRGALNDAIASNSREGASYDAVLAHNIEACVIALTSRVNEPRADPPVIYCVHTLMRHELSAYFNSLKSNVFVDPPRSEKRMRQRVKRVIDRFGDRLDRFAARRADGWIALTQSAARVMRRDSAQPGAIIPPPLPDPRHRFFDSAPRPPLPAAPFLLYSGNLDGYQELQLLDAAARALVARGGAEPRILVASFDAAVADPKRRWAPGIEARHVRDEAEMQALVGAAQATIVPRRAEGGFPIKLANSLAQGTPAITFHDREWGLEDRVEVWRADPRRPVESLAAGIAALASQPETAKRMGAKALEYYRARLGPEVAARDTLALVEAVRAARPG